ncbi:MAG: pantoate--beta-alanine ligase [Candidatus Brocadiia bacterium]|jgi:pantoate--beta-alanine ligase|nr:pantoate--beta-alanine ligase [Candidatus Brocadiia bacterium]
MAAEVLRAGEAARRLVRAWRHEGLSVGLVPTMGGLHEGHLSLLRASAEECDRTVVSIYVNPAQFGPSEDFERYPRRLESDSRAAGQAGADLVFAPTDEVMYPEGFCSYVAQEKLTDVLCGASRPGHFRGVLTVVLKLLNLAPADRAYFGRKDLQQSVVIRRMVADLNVPVEVRVMPTVREADGLAMSSRNEHLSPSQRVQARCLYEAIQAAREKFRDGERSAGHLVAAMREIIERRPEARVQYAEIVSPESLEAAEDVTEESVAVLAAFVGEVRLIDNMPFGECEDVFVSSDR